MHEQAGEAQLPRSSKPPQLPTEEERLLHELTHQPYRSWREVCQRRQTSLPQTTTQRQRECDTNGLWVPTRPTSTTWFTTATTTDSSHNARDSQTQYLQQEKETQHTKDNKLRSGLLPMDSPTAYYKPIQKQQYYNWENT